MSSELNPPYTILVVEDDPIQGFALEMLLGDAGLEVRHFLDSESAEAWLAEAARLPDVILSDYRLAGGKFSGLESIRRLRKLAAQPLAAILVTGDLDEKIVETTALEQCAILHKPYSPAALLDMLHAQLPQRPGIPAEACDPVTARDTP